MENTAFAILLFVLFYSFLRWLFDIETLESPHNVSEKPQDVETTTDTTCKVTEHKKPDIEAQAQKTIETHDTEKTLTQRKKNALEDITTLTDRDIETLSIRDARTIISTLNKGLPRNHKDRIRLKVNGKDHTLDWLQNQIKAKLKAEPTRVTRIVSEIQNAAAA